MSTFCENQTFEVIGCANCGVNFGVPDDLVRQRRKDHGTFYCPSGHSNYFPQDSDKDRLQKVNGQLDLVKTRLDRVNQQLAENEKRLDYAKRASKAASTRLKKMKHRVGHGVCPCCQRTFKQLAAHMLTKHPTYMEPTA